MASIVMIAPVSSRISSNRGMAVISLLLSSTGISPSVAAHKTCNEFDGPPMLTIGSVSVGGRLMRGRRPERLTITPQDADALQAAAHSGSLPWSQVRRAKIVLAIAAGEHWSSVAARLECDEATVWRT